MTATLEICETEDFAACLALRVAVFVEEQGIPLESEEDAIDPVAIHLLARLDGTPVGTARLFTEGSAGHIGRVCVLPQMRGTGLGAALIRAGVERFAAMPGIETVELGAQQSAFGFYEKLGFAGDGPLYDDEGIPHRHMVLRLG